MKTLFVSIFAFLTLGFSAFAQSATEVLDQTAKMLKSSKGIEAEFVATTFKGTKEQSSTIGTICFKEDKFKISSASGDIWFDGKTQWSLYKNSDEVNITNPTQEELQSINPYTFINLYKNGYNATVWGTTYEGKSCHEVRLLAQNKNKALQEMRIVIDKKTLHPYSVRLKQKGDWFRARISQIKTNKKWKDSFFRFNEKDYPNVEVIDMR